MYKHLIIRHENRLNNLSIRCYRPFCLDTKRTKKIKAVFKSYDFLKSTGARKKLAPTTSELKHFFASDSKKSGFE
jgi:hypothetical protein